MKPLLNPSAAADYVIQRLCRRVSLSGAEYLAAIETEHPFTGDEWFWTDDNAKVIEFLSRPEFAGKYRSEAAELVQFVRAMCRGPLMLRRLSAPRLLVTGQKGNEVEYCHSLMHLRTDLSRGVVLAGLRFHDNRTANNLLFHTNCVQFVYRNRRYTIPVERCVDQVDSSLNANTLELRFAGDVFFKPRWTPLRAGRISYLYGIDAGSMVINVEVSFEVDAAADISDVELTVAQDNLSHGINDVRYHRLLTMTPGGEPHTVVAGEAGRQKLPARGTSYYSIVQSEIAGFALAAHSAPRDPEQLAEIEVLVQDPGELHFVRARYRFDGPCRGRRLTVGERKLLTAGGFYDRVDDYSELMRQAIAAYGRQQTAVDYSVSYDYGAELNGFARYYCLISKVNAAEAEDIRNTFDTYLAYYFELFISGHRRRENTVFSRQLAFVILGVVTMLETTGHADYRKPLATLCDVLLDFEKVSPDASDETASGFMMGVHSHRIVFVDCHSAALLALTEAARHLNDTRFFRAIDKGLETFAFQTRRIDWEGEQKKLDLVVVDWVNDAGDRHVNDAFWTFQTGLMLRFFAALSRSPVPELQAIASRHRERIELLETFVLRYLRQSVTCGERLAELRCSILSGETNSETQPWGVIGLMERGWAE